MTKSNDKHRLTIGIWTSSFLAISFRHPSLPMSAAKKQDSSSHSPLFSWLLGAGRPVLIVVLVARAARRRSVLGLAKLKPRILAAPEYRVGPEQVEITPLPAWIHSDIRGEVFRDPKLDGPLSIMDDDLVDRIKEAFAQHPWVAKVRSVRKFHPARPAPSVKVELVYRRPVCMVEVPGKAWAVDAEGVVLPSEDFSPIEATHYLHVVGVDREPTIPAGRRWGDARVVGGAEIAAALGPVWETMKLKQIVPLAADPAAAATMQEATPVADRWNPSSPCSRAAARGSSGAMRRAPTCWARFPPP